MNMNICAIPVRVGSKRIPKKDIKFFNWKPVYLGLTSKQRSKVFNSLKKAIDI